MANKYLSITIVAPNAGGGTSPGDGGAGDSASDWLRLEQEPFEEKSDDGFGDWLEENGRGLALETLTENWSAYKSACGNDEKLVVTIDVHRSRSDLVYTMHASYGELDGPFAGGDERVESVQIEFTTEYELDYELAGEVTATWEGTVFADDGSVLTPPPEITRDGNVLSWDRPVLGSLRLSYSISFESWDLTITPREEYDHDDRASAYESTVWARWGEGNIEQLEIELPEMSGNCGGVSNRGGDDEEEERCWRKVKVVDPCNPDKVLSQRREPMVCPEETTAEDEN